MLLKEAILHLQDRKLYTHEEISNALLNKEVQMLLYTLISNGAISTLDIYIEGESIKLYYIKKAETSSIHDDNKTEDRVLKKSSTPTLKRTIPALVTPRKSPKYLNKFSEDPEVCKLQKTKASLEKEVATVNEKLRKFRLASIYADEKESRKLTSSIIRWEGVSQDALDQLYDIAYANNNAVTKSMILKRLGIDLKLLGLEGDVVTDDEISNES